MYEFLNKQTKLFLFSLIYFFKNKKDIRSEYENKFTEESLNKYYAIDNINYQKDIFLKTVYQNAAIMVFGFSLGFILHTTAFNNDVLKPLVTDLNSNLVLFLCLLLTSGIAFISCLINSIILSYKMYKKGYFNKKEMKLNCLPFVNWISVFFI
ncbi:hypothetical protein D8X55_02520 [Malacoplasma penetrans]|uniref:Uncharacterized protein n=1 Tax=Malacoplasma penetrans (strain HF-2) TaxID=272633 RepID=Q8EWD2_MALP2|nr:hypothetical protein [Malacoplasma penetrans]RXY96757.1 hypothetical protein D8X55_02520 [Malacoplasma penetrans]BAC44064.1 conserved hypothetical protein [Malacoplasma penetrans HF-2]